MDQKYGKPRQLVLQAVHGKLSCSSAAADNPKGDLLSASAAVLPEIIYLRRRLVCLVLYSKFSNLSMVQQRYHESVHSLRENPDCQKKNSFKKHNIDNKLGFFMWHKGELHTLVKDLEFLICSGFLKEIAGF